MTVSTTARSFITRASRLQTATRSFSSRSVNMSKHPPFEEVQASRPDWRQDAKVGMTKTKAPGWKLGQGANEQDSSAQHVAFDPYEEGRQGVQNYKLLISAIVPRPIGFFGTMSKDGKSTNLAPMSYTQVVSHDPPTFVVGIACSPSAPKDTLRNLSEQGECTLNIISEHFVEAANSTSVDSPHGVSEWALSGLTQAPSDLVKPPRVGEAIFTVEGKLTKIEEIESRAKPGTTSTAVAFIEGIRFWAREDAIDETKSHIDPAVLKPIARLGGITYSRLTDMFEIPRPVYANVKEDAAAQDLIKPKE